MNEIANIHYSRSRSVLALTFVDGTEGELTAELLRVCSPSAEVRGHGPGQEVLQAGKKNVAIVDIRQAGHYAVQLIFDVCADQDNSVREFDQAIVLLQAQAEELNTELLKFKI